MPIFITHGRYTADAVKGMVEHSQDRAKAVADLFEHAGGKLLGFYITFGEYDWLSIAEVPDAETNLAILLAGISKATVSEVKTTLAVTPRRCSGPARPRPSWRRGSRRRARRRKAANLADRWPDTRLWYKSGRHGRLPMARNTSVSLGDYYADFVDRQVTGGRYGSVSDVVRAGLRLLEEHEARLEALRAALAEGETSGAVQPLDVEAFLAAKRRDRAA